MRLHALMPDTVPGTREDRARAEVAAPRAREQNQGRRVGLGSETMSTPVEDMGRRSALIVPLTAGNPARGDPSEGRGASRWQSRAWETRRAP